MKLMNRTTSRWFTVFLALLPLVMMYKVPGTELRLPTLLTVVAMVSSLLQLARRKLEISISLLIPFFLYLVYVMTLSSIQLAFLCGAVIIIITAICTGNVNVPFLRRILENVAIIAAVCVIIQQFVHILLGMHISLLIGQFLADDIAKQYAYLMTTGIDVNGMYRPSAFFLEPSHYSQYCTIGLGSCLFSMHPKCKKAIMISLGIIASTSGMGFVSVLAIWGTWGALRHKSGNRIIRNIPLIIVSLFLVIFLLDNISFTHSIISRFTTSDVDSNAIDGRLFWWDTYFGNFSLSEFLRGYGLDSLPEGVYFTGFMKQLYCYGVIGVSLLLLFLIFLVIKSDLYGKICVILYIGLLFLADLTNYNSLLFYIGVYLAFIVASKRGVMEYNTKEKRCNV